MVVSSVLVAGQNNTGSELAIRLALRGLEVTLVGFAPTAQNSPVGVALPADTVGFLQEDATAATSDTGTTLALRTREIGVEVREGTRLVGSIAVDRHVEAELSDGRIENYDLIVIADDSGVRLVASGNAAGSEALGVIARTLANRT